LTKLTKVINERENKMKLIEYPDEDLYEDGELSNDTYLLGDISEVEYKIIRLWRQNKITIAKWDSK
tara:strand:+ start:386 stop:583 length:198 start_codon:yes stop_codon:yes gene_type:complete